MRLDLGLAPENPPLASWEGQKKQRLSVLQGTIPTGRPQWRRRFVRRRVERWRTEQTHVSEARGFDPSEESCSELQRLG